MPITADIGGKNYTLGRGKLFIDRYAQGIAITAATQGDGERYFGNTPEFSSTSTSEDLDHFDSDSGVRVKDDSVQLSFERTGSITVDNISAENLALYFLADGVGAVTSAALTAQTTDATMQRGRFYQLGATQANPAGVRKVSNVVLKSGSPTFATTIDPANYQVDEELGRVYILDAAAAYTVPLLTRATFDVAASTREQVISKNQSIYAALHYIADNPKGVNRDMYIPYAKLTPDGDYNFKGDDWQTMTFTYEILKKASNIEALYINGRATATA